MTEQLLLAGLEIFSRAAIAAAIYVAVVLAIRWAYHEVSK